MLCNNLLTHATTLVFILVLQVFSRNTTTMDSDLFSCDHLFILQRSLHSHTHTHIHPALLFWCVAAISVHSPHLKPGWIMKDTLLSLKHQIVSNFLVKSDDCLNPLETFFSFKHSFQCDRQSCACRHKPCPSRSEGLRPGLSSGSSCCSQCLLKIKMR